MTAKEYLEQINKIDHKIYQKQAECKGLLSCLLPGGIRYDTDKVNTSPKDKMPDVMSEVADLESQIDRLKEKKRQLIAEAKEMIYTLSDDNEIDVLMLYYIGGYSMRETFQNLHCSSSKAYKLKNRALKKLDKEYKEYKEYKTADMI